MKIFNVKPAEAATICGLAEGTLASWRSRRDRTLPWVVRNNRVFYNREDLEAYASSGDLYE